MQHAVAVEWYQNLFIGIQQCLQNITFILRFWASWILLCKGILGRKWWWDSRRLCHTQYWTWRCCSAGREGRYWHPHSYAEVISMVCYYFCLTVSNTSFHSWQRNWVAIAIYWSNAHIPWKVFRVHCSNCCCFPQICTSSKQILQNLKSRYHKVCCLPKMPLTLQLWRVSCEMRVSVHS